MKNEITLQTRREFLRTTVLGSALSLDGAGVSRRHVRRACTAKPPIPPRKSSPARTRPSSSCCKWPAATTASTPSCPTPTIIITTRAPNSALHAQQVLNLNGEIGFHGALTGFKSLYDAGHLAVVQGVGYPNPNRSHFRSTEIWQTASDSDKVEKYGWLGRYFDNACAGCDPTVGVDIGGQTPQAFFAKTPTGICLDNPQNYRFMSPGRFKPGQVDLLEESYEK